jgi:hypothetical protein
MEGDPFEPSAERDRYLLDAADQLQQRLRPSRDKRTERRWYGDTILVRNTTADPLEAGQPIGLGEACIDPTVDLEQFRGRVLLEGVEPTDTAPFAILIEPIGVDEIGRAIISGAVPCEVEGDTGNELHYAAIVGGVLTAVAEHTGCEILYRLPADGLQWAVVRLGGSVSSETTAAGGDCGCEDWLSQALLIPHATHGCAAIPCPYGAPKVLAIDDPDMLAAFPHAASDGVIIFTLPPAGGCQWETAEFVQPCELLDPTTTTTTATGTTTTGTGTTTTTTAPATPNCRLVIQAVGPQTLGSQTLQPKWICYLETLTAAGCEFAFLAIADESIANRGLRFRVQTAKCVQVGGCFCALPAIDARHAKVRSGYGGWSYGTGPGCFGYPLQAFLTIHHGGSGTTCCRNSYSPFDESGPASITALPTGAWSGDAPPFECGGTITIPIHWADGTLYGDATANLVVGTLNPGVHLDGGPCEAGGGTPHHAQVYVSVALPLAVGCPSGYAGPFLQYLIPTGVYFNSACANEVDLDINDTNRAKALRRAAAGFYDFGAGQVYWPTGNPCPTYDALTVPTGTITFTGWSSREHWLGGYGEFPPWEDADGDGRPERHPCLEECGGTTTSTGTTTTGTGTTTTGTGTTTTGTGSSTTTSTEALGACCIDAADGCGRMCIQTTQAACESSPLNPTWLGAGVPCSPGLICCEGSGTNSTGGTTTTTFVGSSTGSS